MLHNGFSTGRSPVNHLENPAWIGIILTTWLQQSPNQGLSLVQLQLEMPLASKPLHMEASMCGEAWKPTTHYLRGHDLAACPAQDVTPQSGGFHLCHWLSSWFVSSYVATIIVGDRNLHQPSIGHFLPFSQGGPPVSNSWLENRLMTTKTTISSSCSCYIHQYIM